MGTHSYSQQFANHIQPWERKPDPQSTDGDTQVPAFSLMEDDGLRAVGRGPSSSHPG